MRLQTFAVILLLVALATAGCRRGPESNIIKRPGEVDVIPLERTDHEMNNAIAEAKRRLPEFLAVLNNPGERTLSAKVRFLKPDGGGEHMWLSDLMKQKDGFSGILKNEPVFVIGMKKGQRVRFAKEAVADWVIENSDGSAEGGFTIALVSERGSGKK